MSKLEWSDRDQQFRRLRVAFERAEIFGVKMQNPNLHLVTMTGEFLRARTEVNLLIEAIVTAFDEPWSEDKLMLMRPL